MKKIGIIGGIGPESTIAYYRQIIRMFQERYRSDLYPELLLHSIDMTSMLAFINNGQLDQLVEFLKSRVDVLVKAGVDHVVLASNTPHLVFDHLQQKVDVHLISIVDECCKYVSTKGMTRLGLLGTKSTMSKGFYQQKGELYGLKILTPNEAHQDFVHDKYMNELVFNDIKAKTKLGLIDIVNDLKNAYQIEGIILGGTELPLVLDQRDFSDITVFDTTQIHVAAIIEAMER